MLSLLEAGDNFALMSHCLPHFGIEAHAVDMTRLQAVEEKMESLAQAVLLRNVGKSTAESSGHRRTLPVQQPLRLGADLGCISPRNSSAAMAI